MTGQNSTTSTDARTLHKREMEEKALRPGNEVSKISRVRLMLELATLIASGMIFAAAFPTCDLAFLGWIGLVPLLLLAQNKGTFKAFFYGLVWGYAWSVTAFFWIREIEFFIPFALALILALFPALWAMVIPFLRRRLLIPLNIRMRGASEVAKFAKAARTMELFYVLSLASWWCILEWIRSWIATGLPWNLLAVTQWQNIPLIQIAEYTGVYGVSFLVILVNISIAMAISGWLKGFAGNSYRRPVPLIMALIIIMLAVLVGSKSMLKYQRMKGEIRFSAVVVQGDIAQCRAASYTQVVDTLDKYVSMTKKALQSYEEQSLATLDELRSSRKQQETFLDDKTLSLITKPDVVIWPETAVPVSYNFSGSIGIKYRSELTAMIAKYKIPFLIGSLDYGAQLPDGKYKFYNAAYLIDLKEQLADKYRKVHIVPFGEFVPFREYLPEKIIKFIDMGRDLSKGERFNPIELKPDVKAGVSICFEDVFTYVSRNQAIEGANLLVVLTNDAWYPTSAEPDQHLANSIFRAVETRLPMIRCGNNSNSCLIAPTGKIIDSIATRTAGKYGNEVPFPQWKGEGTDRFNVSIERQPVITFYTRYGNLFIFLCGILFVLAFAWALWDWKEEKQFLRSKFQN